MLVMGSVVFIPLLFLPVVVLFVSLGKLWILFLNTVSTLVAVAGG